MALVIDDILAKMVHKNMYGLDFYFEPKLVSRIPESYFVSVFNVYLLAKERFGTEVYGNKNQKITSKQNIKLIFVEKRSIFEALHFSTNKNIPDWVTGYVNVGLLAYVQLVEIGVDAPDSVPERKINGFSHEFTHILTPLFLNIPSKDFEDIIPRWIREVLPVWINHKRDSIWLKEEIKYKKVDPTLEQINKNGFFALDTARPEDNVAYQYAALAGYYLGKVMANNQSKNPLGALCEGIIEAYKNNTNLESILKEKRIMIGKVEEEMRKEFGI